MLWRRSKHGVFNIAHRGARSLAPENTLAAARKALECGADMWEIDVCLTRDCELVVVHDDSLERTSNAKDIRPERNRWRVHEFSLEEIRRLDFGSWFIDTDPFGQIAAGWVSREEAARYAGEPAPTLEDALLFTRRHDWLINVEIKDQASTPGDAVIVDKVVSTIENLDMEQRVIVSSFRHDYLEKLRTLNPHIAVGALVLQLPADIVGLLRRLGAEACHIHHSAVDSASIFHLHARGFRVLVWTVNDEGMMRSLIDAGADGLFTDFPQNLTRILEFA